MFERRVYLEVPHFALLGIGEDLLTLHVRVWWVREWAIVEHWERFSNSGVPRLSSGYIDWSTHADDTKCFASSIERHANTSGRAWERFDKAPVHSVSWTIERHPVSHRVASARLALAAAEFCLGSDAMGSARGRARRFADRDRTGEKNFVSFHNIHALSSGADGHFDRRTIRWLSDRRIEREG